MKITVRLAALAACCLQLSLFAAPKWPDSPVQESREAVLKFDESPDVGVIVELAAPPLLEARTRGTVAAAAAGLVDAQLTQLARDLDRIEGRERIAVNAVDRAFRFEYRMVFAGASARVQRTSLAALRALPYVRAVHLDHEVEMHLGETVPHIGAPQVWEALGVRGKGVTIAIIDTGIDYRHWALGKGFGPGFKVVGGYDFFNNDADPLDDHGHGTHVAGIAAGNEGTVVGVAPDATLLAYKVLDEEGRGEASHVLAGIERAIDPNADGDPSDRADVVNMSLGGPIFWNDPLVAAVERGVAAGAVFALSAGNAGAPGTIGSPGAAPSAITVASVDLDDRTHWFSSRGPVGRIWTVKPEVAAPGTATSAYLNGETIRASGTSMAAPHVAGLAALLVQQHPAWTPQQVKAAIVSTAKPLVVEKGVTHLGILEGGGGRIDAVAATKATILPSEPSVSFGLGPKKGEPFATSVTVKLTNHGTAEETLTVKPPQIPAGATFTITPESVTLAPGATAEVTFSIALPAAATPTPKPNEHKTALTGVVELAGAKTSLHLPWMVVNGDVVTATVAGIDEFTHYISRGNDRAPTWWEGPRTIGAFADTTLAVDIAVLTKGKEAQPGRLVLRERLRVYGHTPVTIDPETEAKHTISVHGVDESGVPLAQLGADGAGTVWHYFFLPSFGYFQLPYSYPQRSLVISPLKETQIHTFETLLRGPEHHFAAYRVLESVTGDEPLTIGAGDWATQTLQTTCRTECDVFVGAGGGSPQLWAYHKRPSGHRLWTLHITPRVHSSIDFRAHLFVREQDFVIDRYSNPWDFMSAAFRNHQGRMVVSPLNRLTTIDYAPTDRNTPVSLGDGVITLQMQMGLRQVELLPIGPLGEIFGGEHARRIKASLQTADGKKASIWPDPWAGYYDVTSNPRGAYRMTLTGDYTVAGNPGKVTQVSQYDTRVVEAAPTLSALRVENGRGVVSSTVGAHSAPRLVFSARTSTLASVGWSLTHTPVVADATRVWWRRNGTSEWTALPVTMTAYDFEYSSDSPGSPGNVFSVPLAATAGTEGAVDLKVLLKNELGATTEIVYEPAYIVTPAGPSKRRATR
ncbi:MAG TPA: S8 family serine peptidase [Thermoanaerobaculia bacterium]|nr:S8 family serine peptidase [Thermoanaerobaculia bacterium]